MKKLDKKIRILVGQIATLDAIRDRLSLETQTLSEDDTVYNFFILEQISFIRRRLLKRYEKLSEKRATLFADLISRPE